MNNPKHLIFRPLSLLAALVAVCLLAPTAAFAATDESVARALDYMHSCQNPDGGFAEKGKPSADPVTAWGIVAIASSGDDPNAWKVGGNSPVDFLAKQSASWRLTTDYSRTLLAVVAARKNPRNFGGVDLVAKLHADTESKGEDAEQIGPYVNSHVWGMIALKAAGETPSQAAAHWLLDQQNSDGGWGWAPSVGSDSNDTAAALEALNAAGVSDSSAGVKKGLSYLRTLQTSDGGFGYSPGSLSDANSTSWIVQGLIAAGESPTSWTKQGHNPLAKLRSLQASDGSVRYSATVQSTPLFSTIQALPALARKAFPAALPAKGILSPWRPEISPTSPAAGTSIAVSGSSLAFKLSDGTGTGVSAKSVTMRVDGIVVKPKVSGSTGTVALANLAPGLHSAEVAVKDRAGNTGKLSGWNFTVQAAAATTVTATGSVLSTATDSESGAVTLTAGTAPTATLAGSNLASDSSGASGDSPSKPWWLLVVSAVAVVVAIAIVVWRVIVHRAAARTPA